MTRLQFSIKGDNVCTSVKKALLFLLGSQFPDEDLTDGNVEETDKNMFLTEP